MTTEQLINKVREIMPGCSVSVSEDSWWHAGLSIPRGIEKSYKLSILPGFDGAKCTVYSSDTIQGCCNMLGEHIAEILDTNSDIGNCEFSDDGSISNEAGRNRAAMIHP